MTPLEFLTSRIEQAGLLAPLLGMVVGIVLTLAPISWPSVPAVVALVGPGRAAAREGRPAAVSGARGFAVVLGFVIGLDGVIATLATAFVGRLVLLTRAAVVLTVVAIVVLAYAGVRLLLATSPAVCRRLDSLPDPLRAVSAGVASPSPAAPGALRSPPQSGPRRQPQGQWSPWRFAAFVLGRAGTLYAAAAATAGGWSGPQDRSR